MSPCRTFPPLWITAIKTCRDGKKRTLTAKVGIGDHDRVAPTRNTRSMTQQTPHSPFRTWRRSAAFKQKEIARLLGLRSSTQVSRIERGERVPGLSLAIAIEVLTGLPLEEIIKPHYDAVEEETLARVTHMALQIEESTNHVTMVKVRHLASCQERVITRHRQQLHA